ncbi:MAG: flagellar basal body L-ring protein FlgH [Myxococcales bacterium]|nr:flagellar basal body L-ring protein FlgH [Myxococcota bacterium]MDW8283348.1 flagellar basal body L-ring protein FlgH [Myxococcales bacterium]
MRLTLVSLCALMVSACVGHVLPYTPKVRSYTIGDYATPPRHLSPGSIYVEGPSWVADPRAHMVGDVLTVRIEEGERGTHRATTHLSRSGKWELGIPSLLSLAASIGKTVPGLDLARLLSAQTASQHRGEGETSRIGHVSATMPVRIKRLLPNGDFYIEGSKVVLVNSEEHHIYLSGVVREVDLLADNSVPSTRIADLQIELTGRGVVTEKQNPGWASRVLDYVWPF